VNDWLIRTDLNADLLIFLDYRLLGCDVTSQLVPKEPQILTNRISGSDLKLNHHPLADKCTLQRYKIFIHRGNALLSFRLFSGLDSF
jgi:hypothetical protein